MNEPGGPARGVSAAELGTAVAELQSLVGSVVADVTVVRAGGSDEDLLLVLAGDDAGCKRFVHVALGGTRARLTTTQRRFPKDAFVSRSPHSLLQRELAGARVQHIGATTGERRCALHFATAHGDRRLAIELFGARGLWALLDAEGVVVALSRDVTTKVRSLAIGDRYQAPPPAPRPEPGNEVRFAAPVLASIDEHFTAQDLRQEATAERERVVVAARRALQKALDKERGIGAQLADADRSTRLRSDADMMLALAHTVRRGADRLAFEDPTTGEPREVVLDPSKPVIAQAQALYEKARRLDDGRATAERRHAEATAAIAVLRAVLADLEAPDDDAAARHLDAARTTLIELGALPRSAQPSTKPAPKSREPAGENFRRFVSAEGYPILVGRDNEQNDRLTMRVANGNDLWLHVGGGRPGSHVVIRLPKQKTASLETLLDAAALAVHFSKARGEARIEVVYTQKKHVRKPKGLPAGAVVPSQTKTITSHLDEVRLRRLLSSAPNDDAG